MALALDLEFLKSALSDNKLHISLGKINQIEIAPDRSFIKVLVALFPDQREIVARMTWEAVGTESGFFQIPMISDLVLVAFAEGDFNMAFVIKRLTSSEELIPANAVSGDTVMKANPGLNAWVTGTKINLSKGDTAPTEPVPLGNVLVTLLTNILSELSTLATTLSTHTHVSSAPGAPTAPPVQASSFTQNKSHFDGWKSSPVGDNSIVSNVTFTEKG